ncbi:protein-L-isoaspartate O-methyltransferase family protein [Sphingomonas bacterium]|uniref:protein-L-isoaspartate O-methyltransferase family protein n=1 Tax=Sphingomonas bacterium TaxID=1895847 RepID=UPI0015756B45|nr:protein-L-isoaspartate O-methyltransferase [Sphingomonas bacterium]
MSGTMYGLDAAEPHRFDAMRQAMVTGQLRTTAVDDARLVAAFAKVQRQAFVPQGVREIAYRDTPVPLGRGRSLNAPMATGRLLNQAFLHPADRVLLIGAATGYAATVLALLVREVVAVESDPTLAAAARANLSGTPSVSVIEGPLEAGHAPGAPYDALVIDGAVGHVPAALFEQLGIGGRLTTGLVDRGVTRLASGRRSDSGFGLTAFADAECVVLPGFTSPAAFTF